MKTKNIHGSTLDLLGEKIVAGRYPQGASIPPEPTLGIELGVSRTVVREAVKSLWPRACSSPARSWAPA